MRQFESSREDASATRNPAIALSSKALKVSAFALAVTGIIISAHADDNSYMGGKSLFMYFTIQSNLLIGLIYFMEICFLPEREKKSTVWFIVRFMGVVSISLTGIAFCLLLAPALGQYAWNRHNLATHIIVPAVSIVEFITNEINRGDSMGCTISGSSRLRKNYAKQLRNLSSTTTTEDTKPDLALKHRLKYGKQPLQAQNRCNTPSRRIVGSRSTNRSMRRDQLQSRDCNCEVGQFYPVTE